jgi:hypothetical protein
MKNSKQIFGSLGCCAALGLAVYFCVPHRSKFTLAKPAKSPHVKPDLRGYVENHAGDKDPVVQDKVGEARMHLAFAKANESWQAPKDTALKVKSFEAARQSFLEAASTKGQGKADPNYGTIPEQAAYQAAVCLIAEGKSDQAKKEFSTYMKERPLSPLCKACYDRLNRLYGKHTPEADELYQADVKAQEKQVRFETSVCGPKAIAALLPLLGKPTQPYQTLAKLCGTTDTGTTIEGMRNGLKKLGIQSFGFELNATDFSKMQTPAILLHQDHYLLVKKIADGKVEVFDPTTGKDIKSPLPKTDNAEFTATVITLAIPKL